jgi:hypothetical protein
VTLGEWLNKYLASVIYSLAEIKESCPVKKLNIGQDSRTKDGAKPPTKR